MKTELYRRLAADGNVNAKHIADDFGSMPGEEMDDSDSSTQLAGAIGELNGRAKAHSEAGEHDQAASVHEERGRLHESRGEHEQAKDAYKDALACHKAGDCWGS
jgi:hypothetical protein